MEKHRHVLNKENTWLNIFQRIPFLHTSCLLYLKELYSNTGEHELEQRGDDDNVADGPDGYKHALHNMLETHKRL